MMFMGGDVIMDPYFVGGGGWTGGGYAIIAA